MIPYLIRSIILTAVAYGVYIGLLKWEKTFVFNRFYLLLTLVISLAYPAYHFIPGNSLPSIETKSLKTLSVASGFEEEEITGEVITVLNNATIDWETLDMSFYFLVVAILLIRYIWNLSSLLRRARTVQFNDGNDLCIVHSDKARSPHTFFHYLFVNPKVPVSDSILMHERVHSRQLHSLDMLFVELVKCVYWFNPLVYLYKKAISENHEYLADHQVSKAGIDTDRYITSIISSIIQLEVPNSLSSGFSYLQTKNRIKMLQINKSSNNRLTVKLAGALLAFGLIAFASSFALRPVAGKPLNVFVDVGHGGKDLGATHDEVLEKEVVYQIASRLKEIASSSNINITLTREDDHFVSLKDRVKKVNQINPDLLISLHVNWGNIDSLNGIEAYISEKGEHFDVSKKYAQLLIKEQLANGFNQREIKQTKGLFVIREANCPAIMLALGFLTNENDRQILTATDSYDKLAKSLFNSLSEISQL